MKNKEVRPGIVTVKRGEEIVREIPVNIIVFYKGNSQRVIYQPSINLSEGETFEHRFLKGAQLFTK